MALSALLLCAALAQNAPPSAELSSGGKATMAVRLGAKASPAVRAVASDLARMLGRLSGAEFAVEAGDGAGGIVIGRPADFAALPFAASFGSGPFEREDYVLRSTPTGLYLLGASDLAVSHAAWDVLHRLGFRQFFPGTPWEVLPSARDLSIAVDSRESPAFHARRIWYNWGLWGYNDVPYREWCVRNRMAKGF